MKYTKHTIAGLLFILQGDTISGHKSSNAVQSVTEFFRLEYDAKPQGLANSPDVGILDGKHRSMSGPLPCPATCTDKALCDCIRAYYNPEGDETCLSVMLSGCKNDEFESCYPVDDSKEEYVGQALANAYLYCPLFECLDSLGIKSMYENMTSTYACRCEGVKTMCKKCYEMKDSVPYCEWLLTNYEGACADVTDCCNTATSLEGYRKCINQAFVAAYLENGDNRTPETPSNQTAESKVDSGSAEETSDSHSSIGSKSSCIGSAVAVTSLVAGALAQLNL
eukprot:CCRYP_015509-RA/>CCRYP_015509-RA protein AED:0.41 eAED:0.41 QI:0/-1/0/1/-1/1/1/0/279